MAGGSKCMKHYRAQSHCRLKLLTTTSNYVWCSGTIQSPTLKWSIDQQGTVKFFNTQIIVYRTGTARLTFPNSSHLLSTFGFMATFIAILCIGVALLICLQWVNNKVEPTHKAIFRGFDAYSYRRTGKSSEYRKTFDWTLLQLSTSSSLPLYLWP